MQNNQTKTPTPGSLQPDGSEMKMAAFITVRELQRIIPLCDRTIRAHIKSGKIPSIRLPHSRRLLFDIASVRAAMLSYQTGGTPNYLFRRKVFGLCAYWPRNAELLATALIMAQD